MLWLGIFQLTHRVNHQFPLEDNSIIDLNSQDLEKSFQAGEATLKKIKMEHVRQERQQRIQDMKWARQEAARLDQQQRPMPVREEFGKEEVRPEAPRVSTTEDPQLGVYLENQAAELGRQIAALGNDSSTADVKKKLIKLKEATEKLAREKIAASRLDQIEQKAADFNQEIARLTASGNYLEAQRKYYEFQKSMRDDLVKLKQTMAKENNR